MIGQSLTNLIPVITAWLVCMFIFLFSGRKSRLTVCLPGVRCTFTEFDQPYSSLLSELCEFDGTTAASTLWNI